MFLFIFESIGTSELLLIGVIALIFLGPRRLPEMARKIGKMMAEFRSTTNEFKETWQREANFDEEAKALNLNEIDKEPVARVKSIAAPKPADLPAAPAIKEIDPAGFQHPAGTGEAEKADTSEVKRPIDENDKRNWL